MLSELMYKPVSLLVYKLTTLYNILCHNKMVKWWQRPSFSGCYATNGCYAINSFKISRNFWKDNVIHCRKHNVICCWRQNVIRCERQNVIYCRRQNVIYCRRQNVISKILRPAQDPCGMLSQICLYFNCFEYKTPLNNWHKILQIRLIITNFGRCIALYRNDTLYLKSW